MTGARSSLDSINENIWALNIAIDSLPPGIFPYEAGICLSIHNTNWFPRDKEKDPSYIKSSNFVVNDKVELSITGNHLPNAKPLALVSGTKLLLDDGDSVPFAWTNVPNAEKYRLSIFSMDSQLVYQKETYNNREAVALQAGNYQWKVEAKNASTNYDNTGAGTLVYFLTVENLSFTHILDSVSHNIKSVSGHKDTPMLFVKWGEYADLREWDRPHLNSDFLDENESNSCWAIAIKNLNKHFGGNVTLDEIRWHASKRGADPINTFGTFDGANGAGTRIQDGLKFALDSTVSYNYIYHKNIPLTYNEVKKILKNNQEIYISENNNPGSHAMLIDAYYTTTDGNYVGIVNIDNWGKRGILLADSLFRDLGSYIVIDRPLKPTNMSPLLGVEKSDQTHTWIEWTDSDGDGITDFDEVYRFGTNPNSVDSDSDAVYDKDEIYSYTIRERSTLIFSGSYKGEKADLRKLTVIKGIEDEYLADVDGDGLRAELDPDSDNDGLLDGEDLDPYNFTLLRDSLEINELPKEVVLYALKQLRVNDGTTCINDTETPCIYAAEDTDSDYGIITGVSTSAAALFAKNNVFIRNNPNNTFSVNYYGSNNLTTTRHDGYITIEKKHSEEEWPWKLNIAPPAFDEGDSILVIHRGDSCLLNNNDHFKKLKVESGGIVYFPVGNLFVGDLQLDAGSKIRFEDQSRNTTLYAKGSILWKSIFSYKKEFGFREDAVAGNFRFIYSGTQKIFFDTNWHGTIIAPNSKIVLGQTNNKDLYGQFFAKEIVIHQYSYLVYTPFNPEQKSLECAIFRKNNKKQESKS